MWLAFKIYFGWVLAISLLTFVVYGWDKRQAGREGSRVPESRLHWLTVLGGWPGGLAGQKFFRHKTVKRRFQIVFWVLAVLHIALAVACFAFLIRQSIVNGLQ